MNAKRKKVEDLIYSIMDKLDPSGFNTQRRKEEFSKMSDKEFHHYMELLRDNKTKIPIEAPNMKVVLKQRNLIKAAESLGIELFERVKIWDPSTQRYYLTPFKYMIVELPIRRVKQYLMSKISVPESDKVVNPLSGQVTKPDKGSAISNVEAQTYDSKNLLKNLDELWTVRGGNLEAYGAFKASLENTGSCRLSELDFTTGVRSVVMGQVLLESMHLENNLAEGHKE